MADVTDPNWTTDLVIEGMGVTPYSARGLRQTLTPIRQSSQTRRLASGTLTSVAMTPFRKYASEINGSDFQPPPINAIWPGKAVTVNCIATLAVPVGQLPFRRYTKSWIDGDWIIYQPILDMIITGFSAERDEWNTLISWTLQLQEV